MIGLLGASLRVILSHVQARLIFYRANADNAKLALSISKYDSICGTLRCARPDELNLSETVFSRLQFSLSARGSAVM